MSTEEFNIKKAVENAAQMHQKEKESFAQAKEVFLAQVDRLTERMAQEAPEEAAKIRADAREVTVSLTNPEYEAELFVSNMTGAFKAQKDELTGRKPKPPGQA